MTKEESEHEFKQLCDLLVTRGMARSYIYRDIDKTVQFEYTPAGEALRDHLATLFDIRNERAADLTPQAVAQLVMLILFTPPIRPIIKPRDL